MQINKDITVASRPRSGTTWLIRLLADALDSGACAHYRFGVDPIQYFSENHGGEYLIRKTHDARDFGSPTVVIMRDPRDVAISRMHFNPNKYGSDVTQCVQMLGTCWEAWHDWWERKGVPRIQYEQLQSTGKTIALQSLIRRLTGKELSFEKIELAFERQSFDAMHKEHPHAARKGIVGDWKNYFTPVTGKLITDILGNWMLRNGYIMNLTWWEAL